MREELTDAVAAEPDASLSARVRRSYGDAVQRGHAVQRKLNELRPDTPLLDAGFDLYDRDAGAGGGLLGGAVAFRLFLLSVPALLLAYSGLGFLSHSGSSAVVDVGEEMKFSESILTTMERVGTQASQGRWLTLLVGLWALLLAMRALIKSLRIVHILAWDLDRRRSARSVTSVLVGVGVLVGTVLYTAAGSWLRDRTPGGGVVMSVVLGVGWTAIWLGVQHLLPRAAGSTWKDLLPGAVVVGLAAEALHAATVFYMAGRVSRMSSMYGPLGVAAVLLLWLFVVARSIVLAAMVNATVWDRRQRELRSISPVDVRQILRTVQRRVPQDDSSPA
ncbi:MAG: YhjD/YihY/BrkB family envelope integrity protein [Actinomycetes bacterium]